MKFAILKEHRDFFQKEGLIEFENFLTQAQLNALHLAIKNSYFNRTGIEADRWSYQSSEQLFTHGRDLWRSSDALRKIVCQQRFAQIASELVEKNIIRLGYDQYYSWRHDTKKTNDATISYGTYLTQFDSLNELSSIEGILCGLMICLTSSSQSMECPVETQTSSVDQEKGLLVFSKQAGNAIFFQPNRAIDLKQLCDHIGQSYYLIVYTEMAATYHLQSKDPHTHWLKHLGQTLNSRLVDKLNPIVRR